MGLVGDIFQTVITGGANIRVALKVREYENTRSRYLELLRTFDRERIELLSALSQLARAKRRAISSLKRARFILKRTFNEEKTRPTASSFRPPALQQIQATVVEFETAAHAAGGLAAGALAGVGSWAIVSALGTASTGTAIATLSGAAATNATLAWFGGGALAAGGGGMAAGVASLGGIVVLPALGVTAFLAHKAANKEIRPMNKQIDIMREVIPEVEKLSARYQRGAGRARAVTVDVWRRTSACDRFCDDLRRAISSLGFRYQVLLFLRLLRPQTIVGLGEDARVVLLENAALNLARAVSQPIFDARGEVTFGERTQQLPKDVRHELRLYRFRLVLPLALLLSVIVLMYVLFRRP